MLVYFQGTLQWGASKTYCFDSAIPPGESLGIYTKVNSKQEITNNFPIRINVFYKNSGIVELWNLPDSSDPGYVVKEINQTICFLNEDQNIDIEVILTATECKESNSKLIWHPCLDGALMNFVVVGKCFKI